MPVYDFTGAYPRVFSGLSEGVNAHLNPDAPYGSTVEAFPGCSQLVTNEPYEHPELNEVAPKAEAPVVASVEPAPAVVPPVTEPAPVADPAHDVMTAEGAPAPVAEPTN
jgi:hypothetical protein